MASDHPTSAPLTRIRYLVLTLTTMVAVLLYVDRIFLMYAARYVKEDLRITNNEMSWVLSSFFITYALGQLPAGWLSDRFGARLMLALYLAIWSTFTGLLGFAHGLATVVALRLGCFVLVLSFIPVIELLSGFFLCTAVDGTWYLSADFTQQCYGDMWWQLLPAMVALALV